MATDRKVRKLSPAQQARQDAEAAKKAQQARMQQVLAVTPDRLVEKTTKDGVRVEIWKNPATGKFRVVAYANDEAEILIHGVTLTEARKEAGISYNPPEKLTISNADHHSNQMKSRR